MNNSPTERRPSRARPTFSTPRASSGAFIIRRNNVPAKKWPALVRRPLFAPRSAIDPAGPASGISRAPGRRIDGEITPPLRGVYCSARLEAGGGSILQSIGGCLSARRSRIGRQQGDLPRRAGGTGEERDRTPRPRLPWRYRLRDGGFSPCENEAGQKKNANRPSLNRRLSRFE